MSFADSLSIAVDLEDAVNQEVRATALNILTGVVLETPKDTGRAQGGWQTTTGSAATGQKSKSRRSTGALSEGARVIKSARNIEYPTIVLANNLPYIVPLNSGHSEQAPAGYVEAEIKRVINV